MKKLMYAILLLVLPSVTIELLSGSTPPVLYFNPVSIAFLVAAYGLPFILLREMKVRLQLDWSFIFLLPIIGIFIEGIFMQSFFNIAHMDLNELSQYGMYFGVQWPWTIYLIIYHGLLSLVAPLFILDILFPSMKNKPVLNKITTILSLVFILLVTTLQFWIINSNDQLMYLNYNIDIFRTFICLLIILLLIGLAYIFRESKVLKKSLVHKKRHHFYGFIYMVLLLFATYLFIPNSSVTITLQVLLSIVILFYAIKYMYGSKNRRKQLMPYFNGLIVYASLLAIMQEAGWIENLDPTKGMATVGLSFLMLTVIMNIKVSREDE